MFLGEKNHHASTITQSSPMISGTAGFSLPSISRIHRRRRSFYAPTIAFKPPSAGHIWCATSITSITEASYRIWIHIIRCHLRILTARKGGNHAAAYIYYKAFSPGGNHLPDVVPVSVPAKELQYRSPVTRVTNWLKCRHGRNHGQARKISSANVDEVKSFLPETFYTIMKETDRWGESWFEIVPYRQVRLRRAISSLPKNNTANPSSGPLVSC